MTTTTPFVPALEGPSVWQRLDAAWRAVAEGAARRRLYRSTLSELDALGDRDLADLGLDRSQIRAVSRRAAQAA